MFTSIAFIVLALISHAIAGNPSALPNTTYLTVPGYFNNKLFHVYIFDIYKDTPAPAIARVNPIYVFLKHPKDNIDNILQPSIIDLIPGDDGYSDLKRVNIVTGIENCHSPITSYDDLKKLGKKVKICETDIYLNIPVDSKDNSKFPHFLLCFVTGS
ncbi:17805_t:CDS:2 [Racocetra persica]|uniref:17805_t:CDS:1 n=1 Tax=Racocetra persica TaxID=160502 RepID=A0ACA9MX19_9GLOM|nr:17805_t:CDS:2 [Racocetra persica]